MCEKSRGTKIHLESALGGWPACGDLRVDDERIAERIEQVTCQKCLNLAERIWYEGVKEARAELIGRAVPTPKDVQPPRELTPGTIVFSLIAAAVTIAALAWIVNW